MHRYQLKNGDFIPTVTQIISQNLGWGSHELINWAGRQGMKGINPNETRRRAASKGNCVHKVIEGFLKGVEPYLGLFSRDQRLFADRALESFKAWSSGRDLEFIHAEHTVISETYKYGGQIDVVVCESGRLLIVDLKTTKSLWPNHLIQISAYAAAYSEQEGIPVDQCHILRLDKAGSGYGKMLLTPKQVSDSFEVFTHLRAIHEFKDELL